MNLSDEQRFWENVERGGLDDDCWEWIGSRHKQGYGNFYVDGNTQGAHRVAWQLHHRLPVPAELHVCHHCDNPPCVRPDHLFLGTRSDNALDAVQKGRVMPPSRTELTHCKRGHEFTPENTYIKAGKWRSCRECQRAHHRKWWNENHSVEARLLSGDEQRPNPAHPDWFPPDGTGMK